MTLTAVPPVAPTDGRAFRTAMSAFATGVTVVTAAAGAEPHGMTVSAFASLSLDPMLLLVCLNGGGHGAAVIERSGAFAVNVLAAEQQDASCWFASRNRPTDWSMFDGFGYHLGRTGSPLLDGACATFDCTVDRIVPGGDHVIVIGAVVDVRHDPDRDPLLFHAGRYRAATDSPVDARAALRSIA